MTKLLLALLTLFALQQVSIAPQAKTPSPLHKEIMALDSVLFEEGFNGCDLDAVEALLTEDFEFYHDQNGTQDWHDTQKRVQRL